MADEYEYPTRYAIRRIRTWPYEKGWVALMDYVKARWWTPEWGWTQEGRFYRFSTGGWSGNESLVGAMEGNRMFWSLCWESSRRGGHYVIEIPEGLA